MRIITSMTMRSVCMAFSLLVMIPSVSAQDTLQLDLKKALQIALTESPTVKLANQEIQKKKYARRGSYSSLFPQVDFTTDYSRTLKKQVMYMDIDMKGKEEALPPGMDPASMDKGFEVGRSNNWSTGFRASMPLINASLWKSLSISGTDVELAVEEARSSKLAMRNEVKKSFYNVLLAKDSYQVFHLSYTNALRNYRDIKQKYEQGVVAEYDLIRADVMVKNTEPNVLQAESAISLAQWRLKALMGIDLDQPIDCIGTLREYESNLYADYLSADTLLTENSDLKQIALQSEQLKKTLLLRKFDYLPTLSLTGMYQWTAMNNDFKFKNYRWNPYSVIGLSLTIPILSGGNKYYKIKEARISLDQLAIQKDDTERNLKLAVKQHTDNMRTSIKRFEAARRGVEQAEKGYAIAQKRYDTGAGTLLELNDAELAMTQARLNFNQSIYDYMVARADLEKVLGRGL